MTFFQTLTKLKDAQIIIIGSIGSRYLGEATGPLISRKYRTANITKMAAQGKRLQTKKSP